MKVTIVTVTLNAAAYLEQCIQSVISQRHDDIEHIIVDGGSTDGTLPIIKRYQRHIAQWVTGKDNGMYDAINRGMRMATGDIIGTLNSDDVLANREVVGTVVATFLQYPVQAVYGDIVYVQPYDLSKVSRVWNGGDYNRNKFKFGWMPAHPSFYISRSLVAKLGYYETHFHSAADYEFMTRYLYLHKVTARYIPELMVKMRMGGISNGNISRRLRANRRDYLAMRKNNIPFALVVSVLKPLRKINQYKIVPYNPWALRFRPTATDEFYTADENTAFAPLHDTATAV